MAYKTKGEGIDQAEAEEACANFERTMRAQMRTGTLPWECPHCGSHYSVEWEMTLSRTHCTTVDELNNDLAVRSAVGSMKAYVAAKARAEREAKAALIN